MMEELDKRLNAYREDIADEVLRGRVEALRFVKGEVRQIGVPVVDLRSSPRPDSGVDTQLLMGQRVKVFNYEEGYAWVQSLDDRYVGYVGETALLDIIEPTHRVCVPRTFLYPGPDLRLPIVDILSMGNRIEIVKTAETRGTLYGVTRNGQAVVMAHLETIETKVSDYVTCAEKLVATPYLWGGKSGFGIDCSGLVQLSMMMAGKDVLRDTDMQQASIGTEIVTDQLERGDLVFWKGHVAIMLDDQNIIHANGASMDVAIEPLYEAIERIARFYERPVCYRRP